MYNWCVYSYVHVNRHLHEHPPIDNALQCQSIHAPIFPHKMLSRNPLIRYTHNGMRTRALPRCPECPGCVCVSINRRTRGRGLEWLNTFGESDKIKIILGPCLGIIGSVSYVERISNKLNENMWEGEKGRTHKITWFVDWEGEHVTRIKSDN